VIDGTVVGCFSYKFIYNEGTIIMNFNIMMMMSVLFGIVSTKTLIHHPHVI